MSEVRVLSPALKFQVVLIPQRKTLRLRHCHRVLLGFGMIAQLVERCTEHTEATGSIPVHPTTIRGVVKDHENFLTYPHSLFLLLEEVPR